uniref:SMP-30/Gluconolactonase/LRE-like region domain-containing protein n=2 Tax=Amorphochlora amoebiformis TaxID=1561963 RepID=A0A7S0CNB8_9EUKA
MPAHLAFDVGSRSLIVADITAHRIRRVRLEGNTTITCEVTTLATPEATTTSSHVEPSRPRMTGLATAPDGSIYVSFSGWMSGSLLEYGEEEKGHWIDKYSSDGVLIERIGAALGDSGRKGLVDGAPSQARFDSPSGLAVSPRGDLYICDAGNAQVRRLAARPSRVHGGPRGPWVVDSWVGSGERGWKDGRLSVAQFSYPTAIAWDSVGNGVIIGDSGSLRIRRISKAKIDLWLRELYPDTAISELVDIRRTRSDENLEIKRIREQAQELRRMRHKFKSEKKAIYEQQYDSKMKLDSEDEAMTGKKINKKSMKGIMKKQWRARAALQEGGLTDSSEMPDELGVNEMLI